MAVMVLFFASGLFCNLQTTRADRAELDIKNINSALKLYRAQTGRYPTTQEGLCALVQRRILEALPRDPWNIDYHYALWRGLPVIWSYGADGLLGGAGGDTDLSNRSLLPPGMLEGSLPIPDGRGQACCLGTPE